MKSISYCLANILVVLIFSSVVSAQTTTLLYCPPEDAEKLRSFKYKTPEEIFDGLPEVVVDESIVNRSFIPKVFKGYHRLHPKPEFLQLKPFSALKVMTSDSPDTEQTGRETIGIEIEEPRSDLSYLFEDQTTPGENESIEIKTPIYFLQNGEKPKWLQEALTRNRLQEELNYSYMIDNPLQIEYAYWDLPEPPVLFEDDVTFLGFLRRQEIPEINPDAAVIPENEIKKKFWLHTVGAQLQFSQAFVSPNWYQGGNDYLALLFNFNWNVQLNQVFHPNLLFQSNLQYKLAISSTPKGNIHKYLISEDAFQYNLNTGLKAFGNWFYSFNLQFKTQLFNNYADNSYVRKSSLLSPGDLNLGLGMTYNRKNKLNTFSYTLTISPLSYNLKTCISDKVNHLTYNIPLDKKTKSEIGSNLEFNMNWKITANISYNTRAFLFTDYSYFLGDWQNTFSFDINKFLSTQLFVHLRWDTSAERDGHWKTFMMREILSFGLSYTFSTKP